MLNVEGRVVSLRGLSLSTQERCPNSDGFWPHFLEEKGSTQSPLGDRRPYSKQTEAPPLHRACWVPSVSPAPLFKGPCHPLWESDSTAPDSIGRASGNPLRAKGTHQTRLPFPGLDKW